MRPIGAASCSHSQGNQNDRLLRSICKRLTSLPVTGSSPLKSCSQSAHYRRFDNYRGLIHRISDSPICTRWNEVTATQLNAFAKAEFAGSDDCGHITENRISLSQSSRHPYQTASLGRMDVESSIMSVHDHVEYFCDRTTEGTRSLPVATKIRQYRK